MKKVMTDRHPEIVDFDINWKGVALYKQATARSIWSFFIGSILVLTSWRLTIDWLEHSSYCSTLLCAGLCLFTVVAIGVLISIAIARLITHLMKHRYEREAKSYHISIHNDFLRIQNGAGDNKSDELIHFRDLYGYTFMKNSTLNKCGIEAISIYVLTGTQQSRRIRLLGIDNALEARDLLAEVDALREKR